MRYPESAQWFTTKLIELQKQRGELISVTDFADILGKSQPTASAWLRGTRKPNYPNAVDVASKLHDPTILDVLHYTASKYHSNLPPKFRRALDSAEEEANRVLAERGLTAEMPEAERITIEIFERWGIKYTSTENDDEESV